MKLLHLALKMAALAVVMVSVMTLGGCKSTKTLIAGDGVGLVDSQGSAAQMARMIRVSNNDKYVERLDVFRQNPQSITYKTLWLSYVDTDFLSSVTQSQALFDQAMLDVQSGQRGCESLQWDVHQKRLFFSTKLHMVAQECFDVLGHTDQSDYHTTALNFILKGLFANGDGKHHYSAFEVPTANDASDIVELTGLDVLDNYVELGKGNKGLYYVFVLNDPESGEQQQLYFDFTRFLHEALEIDYPFGWASNQMTERLVIPFAKSNLLYRYAMAQLLVSEQKYDQAAQQYLAAIAQNAIVANYRLGRLCQQRNLQVLDKSECFDYLLASAKGGYAKGVIAVAELLRTGQGIEPDKAGFEQLMTAAQRQLPGGQAWFELATNSKTPERSAFFERAAQLGSTDAKMALLIVNLQAQYKKEGEALSLDPFYADFGRLAEQGGARVKTIYARYLSKYNKVDKNGALAKLMLLAAAEKGYPEANYQLGRIYRYGKNEAVNYPLAQQYYLLAAQKFHLDAQLELGLMYDHGKLGNYERKEAFRWFTMCRRNLDLWCLHNMAIMMREGHVSGVGYAEAIDIFKFIASQNHPSGTNNYAAMLNRGQGVAKDSAKAFELFKKAADMGDQWAQFNLCKIYYYGSMTDTVAKNQGKGIYWCEKSAEQGHTQAKAKLQEIRG